MTRIPFTPKPKCHSPKLGRLYLPGAFLCMTCGAFHEMTKRIIVSVALTGEATP